MHDGDGTAGLHRAVSAVSVPAGRRYRRRVTADPATSTSSRPGVAWPGLAALAGGMTLMLLAVANRYGYHRDELYFLRAGREPACGYVDQPPLTPLLAHAMDRRSTAPWSGCGCRRRWWPGWWCCSPG